MTNPPVICFGQQPCGFFPKRFLVAKIMTARKLRDQIGGEVVFFYHDSDHDPRETKTKLRHRKSWEPFELNFTFENKLQRKYSPLYLKRVLPDWHQKTALQLPAYVDRKWVEAFKNTASPNVADFCLEMYDKMGLLEGVRVVRSSDPAFRNAACDVSDFFVDVSHGGEIVRARRQDGALKLHEGGNRFLTLPACDFTKQQISPTRDSRLRWMQSIVHCTHYVSGASEQDYINKADAPEIIFVNRETIERSDEAYTEIPT
jgi:hypothetical protein